MAENTITYKPVNVRSTLFGADIALEAYETEGEDGKKTMIITHNSLKKAFLKILGKRAQENKNPHIRYSFHEVVVSPAHCVVDCTFSLGEGYVITESGETTTRTLASNVAKDYPYLEAQKRAFDRALISFLQLDVDGKVFSDSESVIKPE